MDPTTAVERSRAWHRWLCRWTALSVPLFCLAVLFWGPAVVGWASAAITIAVVVGHALSRQSTARISLASRVRSVRPLVLFGITFPLGWAVLADLSVSAALGLALVAAATSPPSVAWYHRLAEDDAGGAVPVVPDSVLTPTATLTALLADPAQRMTDAQLCKAWRDSFLALEASRTARETMLVVALRQSFLDALGERNPQAFQAWMASNPQPSAGPDRFLRRA
jgi:hypothetical protein